jgi:transketolase
MGELQDIAARVRGKVVELSHDGKTPHLGSSLSCVDVVVAAYWSALNIDPGRPEADDRDRFILSKGHAATTLYSALAFRGFYDPALLETYNKPGGKLAEHPSPQCVPGVEAATGSLGHGLPLGVGMALAARIRGLSHRVVVLMSDGECNEGSVWEAAMMAGGQKLENVMAIVDFNKWQATARSTEVMALEPLAAKFEASGWTAHEVDGHDVDGLAERMASLPDGSGKPVALIAHTIKGKGVSFMEDDNNWHYRVPTDEEVVAAHRELGLVA